MQQLMQVIFITFVTENILYFNAKCGFNSKGNFLYQKFKLHFPGNI